MTRLTSTVFYNQGYIMLRHQISLPKGPLRLNDHTFYPKPEFHISLICTKNYTISSKVTRKIIYHTKNFLSTHNIRFKSFFKSVKIAKREDRCSIIIRVKLIGLSDLYRFLMQKTGLKMTVPPTHITLFTLKNGKGIGINNLQDLHQFTTPLSRQNSQIVLNLLQKKVAFFNSTDLSFIASSLKPKIPPCPVKGRGRGRV